MSYLVANPEDRFTLDEAQLPSNITIFMFCTLVLSYKIAANLSHIHETFDQDHLEEINGLIQNHDNSIFPKVDSSSLNAPISRAKVRHSIYYA